MAKRDQELLLYPLLDDDRPPCPACHASMTVYSYEACGKTSKMPDFATFYCEACGRSERFVATD